MNDRQKDKDINRRGFLGAIAATGVGAAIAPMVVEAGGRTERPDILNVALIGAGTRGWGLAAQCMKIPYVRFRAVCDIWDNYSLRRVATLLKKYRHDVNTYTDFTEMLASERALDAVIIATPDFWHAEQTVQCLKSGLHVYCEQPMANTVEDGRRMVRTAAQAGRLLQIGNQKRSNELYRRCREKLIRESAILGHIGTVNGQWNHLPRPDRGYPKGKEISPRRLYDAGYSSMEDFCQWYKYKCYCAGPITRLPLQQLDVYNWFLGARPASVLASDAVGRDTGKWCDQIMAVFDYQTGDGIAQAFYQTMQLNAGGQHYELFAGDKATLVISDAHSRCEVHPEPCNRQRPEFDDLVKSHVLKPPSAMLQTFNTHQVIDICDTYFPLYVTETCENTDCVPYSLSIGEMPYPTDTMAHLVNFFAAIRGKDTLNCPGEIGFEALVTALKVNEAIESDGKVSYRPSEFVV